MFDLIPGVTAQVDAGQVKALAVSSPVPSQAYPDLPTLEQAGVADIDATNWYGIVAPAGTPQEIIDKMSEEIRAIVQEPRIADQLIGMGVEPTGTTPEEFRSEESRVGKGGVSTGRYRGSPYH